MLLSKSFVPILKNNPSEAKIKSHQLMLRVGMIKQASAEACLIIPTLNISWWDLIFASDGLFFKIGTNDLDNNILSDHIS